LKVCPSCKSMVDALWRCETCSWSAKTSSAGILSFTDKFHEPTQSYDPSWYQELAKLEVGNFWFEARNTELRYFLRKYCPQSEANYLEIGCGSGFVLGMIRKTYPNWNMIGSEAFAEGLQVTQSRVPNVTFAQLDAQNIPFENEFDVIGAFDVIEHIEDDQLVLNELFKSLKQNGLLFITVPQHMFLWSDYDEVSCHFRRYSYSELKTKFSKTGFEIVDSTSFTSLLMPLMLLSRIFKKGKSKKVDVLSELRIPPVLNKVLTLIMKAEYSLLKLGFRWPFGGSRLIVVRRKNRNSK
jgi:SAM-dependent methyltransferase